MTDSSRGYQQFFAELKRRRVFRVMAVYGIVGFVLLQIVDLAVPALLLPEWTYRFVSLILLLGFPIAVVLAWAFESTPDGVRRTADAAPGELSEIIAQPASKRWLSGLLALSGVVLLFGGGWWMGQRDRSGAEPNLVLPQSLAADFRTIAVLPFENMGGDEENLVLASGLHADVETQLSRLADLRVVSVQDYDAAETTVREIARELGVDYLLLARVRRSGNQVRVNVFLIDAATRENLWVDDFDREITPENLFAIQSDIARRVADRLEAQFSSAGTERLEAGFSTDNMAAINLYYRSKSAEGSAAVDLLDEAIELDPGFVEAWMDLVWLQSFGVLDDQGDEKVALGTVERIEALAPGSLEAIKARAFYTAGVEEDWGSALVMFRAAEKLAPSDAHVQRYISWLHRKLGDPVAGARSLRRLVALDPQDVSTLSELAKILYELGRWGAADQVIERALALDPSNGTAQILKVDLAFAIDRDPQRARRLASEFGFNPDEWLEGWSLAWLAMYDRDYEAAKGLLAGMPSSGYAVGETNRLSAAVWVEQLRGGDPAPFLDTLLTIFSRQSLPDRFKRLEASGRVLSGDADAGFALLAGTVERARATDNASTLWWVATMWWVASNYAQLGRPERALAILEEVVGRPVTSEWGYEFHLASLEKAPWYDELRGDPRFEEIVRRQREYEEEQARIAETEGPWLP